MKKSPVSRWFLAAALAALLPVSAASGRGMGGPPGMGPRFSQGGGFGRGHEFAFRGHEFGRFRDDRFFRHRRFFVRDHRFFRHRDRFFFGFNFVGFGPPWFGPPYPYPYWYPGYPYGWY